MKLLEGKACEGLTVLEEQESITIMGRWSVPAGRHGSGTATESSQAGGQESALGMVGGF